jgi:hypothetical protein
MLDCSLADPSALLEGVVDAADAVDEAVAVAEDIMDKALDEAHASSQTMEHGTLGGNVDPPISTAGV